jgi:hypothetical protein
MIKEIAFPKKEIAQPFIPSHSILRESSDAADKEAYEQQNYRPLTKNKPAQIRRLKSHSASLGRKPFV